MDCDNGQNCRNHIIDATLADELTINCTGTTCDGSLILCPISDNSSCNIYCDTGSCKYATIRAEGNNMDNFNLQCGYSSGCQYVDLQLTSTSINNVIIDCSNTYSCSYTSFTITSTINNDFNLTCTSTGCFQMDISIPSTSINTLSWKCPDSNSCELSTMTFTNDITINSFIKECDGSSSCYNSSIDTTSTGNLIINSLELSCSASQSCTQMILSAQISNSAIIECTASSSCMGGSNVAQVDLVSIAADVNYIINCVNPSGSTQTNGACYTAMFSFAGYVDPNNDAKNNNLTLTCGEYDCDELFLYAPDLNNAAINCNHEC